MSAAVNLSEIAGHVEFILADHEGRERAIHRILVLEKLMAGPLRGMGEPSADRAMRKSIARFLPRVCSCADGYYLAESISERKAAASYIIKKIIGLRKRADAITEGYPELEAFVQQNLPGMEART